jgi:hypothetical protein
MKTIQLNTGARVVTGLAALVSYFQQDDNGVTAVLPAPPRRTAAARPPRIGRFQTLTGIGADA